LRRDAPRPDGALKAGPEWRMEVLRESEVVYRLTFSAEAFNL